MIVETETKTADRLNMKMDPKIPDESSSAGRSGVLKLVHDERASSHQDSGSLPARGSVVRVTRKIARLPTYSELETEALRFSLTLLDVS